MTQPHITSSPLALICIAALEDAALLSQWEAHLQTLRQANLITFWSEYHISGGFSREQEWNHQLDQADLIALLLSADFFASPDCLTRMEQALQRSHIGGTRLIAVLLRPVAWQESPLAELAYWPPNGVPITQWTNRDAAWDACVQNLRRLLRRRVAEVLPSEHLPKYTDPDWARMLRRLRHIYKELLDQSLHGIAWVELGLAARPELVSNATHLLLRLPQDRERLLVPGTSILDAFDEAEEELLILQRLAKVLTYEIK